VVSRAQNISLSQFTRDPAAIMGVHPFTGVLSNLGILLWCASASVCLFSSLVLLNQKKRGKNTLFFLFAGCLTFILLLDDLFLLHEVIAPALYIPEKFVFASYVSLVLLMLTKFRTVMIRSKWVILVAAFFFFGASVFLDLLPVPQTANFFFEDGWKLLVEDSLKLLGIVCWFGYFSELCFQVIKNGSKSRLLIETRQTGIERAVILPNREHQR
jgi:hypothetical protein